MEYQDIYIIWDGIDGHKQRAELVPWGEAGGGRWSGGWGGGVREGSVIWLQCLSKGAFLELVCTLYLLSEVTSNVVNMFYGRVLFTLHKLLF